MGLFGSIGKVLGAASDTIGGGLLSGGLSLVGGQIQNSSAKSAANAANAFTTEQLKNRHQWEVQDLKKAGLNPILSAGGTPSIGGSSTADVPSNSLGNAVSSAMAAKQLAAQISNLDANTKKADADAGAASSTDRLNQEAIKTQKTQQFVNAQLGNLYNANAHNVNLDSGKKAVEAAVYTSALSPVKSAADAAGSIFSPFFNAIKKNVNDVINYPYSKHFSKGN